MRRVGDDLPTVTLKGNAYREGKADISINGYVFTPVPKDFWEEWLRTHADSSLLRDGFIKAATTEANTKAVAREHAEEPGQFERLSPGRDPKDKHRSVQEIVTRGGRLGVKPYDKEDMAA